MALRSFRPLSISRARRISLRSRVEQCGAFRFFVFEEYAPRDRSTEADEAFSFCDGSSRKVSVAVSCTISVRAVDLHFVVQTSWFHTLNWRSEPGDPNLRRVKCNTEYAYLLGVFFGLCKDQK